MFADSWNYPSLLVTNADRVVRVVPGTIGTLSHEVVHTFKSQVTALAVDNLEQTVYAATSSNNTGVIYSFTLVDPSKTLVQNTCQ